jgi:hypothetical protein
MVRKYVLAWFPMVPIAILNGAIRQAAILPLVGELPAHQISCFTGILLLGLYMYWVVRKWTPVSMRQAVGLGILWVAMTIAFEFVFGHFVMGNSWERLFHDYDLSAGRLWVIVLLWTAAAPAFLRWLVGSARTSGSTRAPRIP